MSHLQALTVFLVIYISQTASVESQITQQCLDCICQASTGCDLSKKCQNSGPSSYFCGPYQISWSYWSDGGRPGDQGGPHDFETCLNDKSCAEQAIYGYMNKWARDCNGDGVIDCADYAAIHKAGPHSCNAQWLLDSEYWRVFQSSSCASGTLNFNGNYNPPRDSSFGESVNGESQPQPQPQPHTTHWTFPSSRNNSYQPVAATQPGYRSYGGQPERGRYNNYNVPSNNNNPLRHEVFGPSSVGQPPASPVIPVANNDEGVLRPYPSNQPSPSSNNGPESGSFSSGSSGQPSTVYNEGSNFATNGPVDSNCLECLCQASTGCDVNKQCFGNVCGPYLISWPFWADAGKPGTDYVSCALRKNCAEAAVQGYMSRFARDCNNDGVINCDDYIMIHQYGPNCGPGVFGTGKFWQEYKNCHQPPIDARSNRVRESNVERFRPIERPGQPANLRRDETSNWNGANNRFNENEIPGIRSVDRNINQPEGPDNFNPIDDHLNFHPFPFTPPPSLNNFNLSPNPTRPNSTGNVYFNDLNFSNPPFNTPNPSGIPGQPPINNNNNNNINPPRNSGDRFQPGQPRYNPLEQPPVNRFRPEPSINSNNDFRPVPPIDSNAPSGDRSLPRPIENTRTNLDNNGNGFQPGVLRTDGFRPILNPNPNNFPPNNYPTQPNNPPRDSNFDANPTPRIPSERFTPRYDRPNGFNFPPQPTNRPFSGNNDYFSRSPVTIAPPTSPPLTPPSDSFSPVSSPTTISPISVNEDDESSLLPGPRDSRFLAPSKGNVSMTAECLECICEASSKCDASFPCKNYGGSQACGPYQITISYWLQSGKPGYKGGSSDFINCVTNMDCAQETLKGYVKNLKRDCNNDGAIDCLDYALIHKLGPNACQDQSFLDSPYWNDFQACYGFER